MGQNKTFTHSFEVLVSTLHSPELAVQHHILETMPNAVIKLMHIEYPWLVMLEISFLLENFQHKGISQLGALDLQVDVEQTQELASVVEIIGRQLRKAKLVQVADSHGGKDQVVGGHLFQLGDVRVREVKGHAFRAFDHE